MAGLIYKELWHSIKVRKFLPDEGWLWILCISYACDHDTNGYLDKEEMALVIAMHHLPTDTAERLVKKGGLDVSEGRFRIHNWLMRAHLSRLREKAGRAGGQNRWESKSNGTIPPPLSNLDIPLGSTFASVLPSLKSQAKAIANGEVEVEVVNKIEIDIVERIFGRWCASIDRRVRLTPGRRKVTVSRLKEGYSEEDLNDAACGWKNDPWPERPRYNDLTILFRNGEQVEKFRDLWRQGPVPVKSSSQAVKNALFLLRGTGG